MKKIMYEIPPVLVPLAKIAKAYSNVRDFVNDFIKDKEEFVIVQGRFGVSKISRGSIYEVDTKTLAKSVGSYILACVHSHPSDFSFSITDLKAFLYHPFEIETYLITPSKIYRLIKPHSLIEKNLMDYLKDVSKLERAVETSYDEDQAIQRLIRCGFMLEEYDIENFYELAKTI